MKFHFSNVGVGSWEKMEKVGRNRELTDVMWMLSNVKWELTKLGSGGS